MDFLVAVLIFGRVEFFGSVTAAEACQDNFSRQFIVAEIDAERAVGKHARFCSFIDFETAAGIVKRATRELDFDKAQDVER